MAVARALCSAVLLVSLLQTAAATRPCSLWDQSSKLIPSGVVAQQGTYRVSFAYSGNSTRSYRSRFCGIRVLGYGRATSVRVQSLFNMPFDRCFNSVLLYRDASAVGQLAVCTRNISEAYQNTWDELTVKVSMFSQLFDLKVERVLLDGKPVSGNRAELQATSSWKYLRSFGYPNGYPNSMNFTYFFRSESSKSIEISVLSLRMQNPSTACVKDYIEVQEAHTSVRWCTGSKRFVSQESYLILRFLTNSRGSARGFELKYREVERPPLSLSTVEPNPNRRLGLFGWSRLRDCPLIKALTARRTPQILTSPGYPYGYESNLDCRWIIQNPGGDWPMIEINFSVVNLEVEANCLYDNVTVYEGEVSSSHEKGSFCTTSGSRPILSRSLLIVRFRTDANAERRGFNLTYRLVEAAGTAICNRTVQVGTEYSYLESPNHPNFYPNSLDCWWKLEAPEGHLVAVRSEDFRLEDFIHQGCVDWVSLHDGPSSSATSKGKFCGNKQVSLESSGREMFVHFHTDSSIVAPGFRLRLRAQRYPTSCEQGRVVNVTVAVNVLIQSPNYPDNYPKSSMCMWRLKAGNGRVLQLKSAVYDLGVSSPCSSNIVNVYDGPDRLSKILGRFCSGEQGSHISSSEYLFVEFMSDSRTQQGGFQVEISERSRSDSNNADGSSSSKTNGFVWVMLTISGVALTLIIVSVCCCICCCLHMRRRKLLQQLNGSRQATHGNASDGQRRRRAGNGGHLPNSHSHHIAFISGDVFMNEAFMDLPPPYPGPPTEASLDDLPPPYPAQEFAFPSPASDVTPPPYSLRDDAEPKPEVTETVGSCRSADVDASENSRPCVYYNPVVDENYPDRLDRAV